MHLFQFVLSSPSPTRECILDLLSYPLALNNFIKVQCRGHAIHSFKVHNLLAPAAFTKQSITAAQSAGKHFHHPPGTLCSLSELPNPPSSWSEAAVNLLPVFTDLPVLDLPQKWGDTWEFCECFFHWVQCFQGSPTCNIRRFFVFNLNNILYVNNIFHLSIH